jgi:hypothetical protein
MLILRKALSATILLVLLFTILPLLSDLQPTAASSALQDGSNLSTVAQELDPAARDKVIQAYGNLPLFFTANNGQVDSSVLYYAHVADGKVYLTPGSIVLDLARREANNSPDVIAAAEGQEQAADYQRLVIRLNFEGANTNPEVIATEKTASRVNYLIGNDQSKWLTDIPTYEEVVYSNVYRNIDLRLYGKEGLLTYDFIVHPGGNVDNIRLALEGIDGLDVNGRDLVLRTAFGELKQQRLSIYQGEKACRKEIEGNFKLLSETGYGFTVAAYNRNADLVIDPGLAYSTYLGGAGDELGQYIAVDTAGCAYVTGNTASNPFPTTAGAYQTAYGGGVNDAFVTKLNPTGTALVYSTYLGGGSNDVGLAIAVDTAGYAYVAGETATPAGAAFPITGGAYQTTFGGGVWDAFVAKLNTTGSNLVYSTFLGGVGDDYGYGIAVDAAGNAYVACPTDSNNFPTTPGAFQTVFGGNTDGSVTKLNPAGSARVYSTYLGGPGYDVSYAVAVDTAGFAYVGGYSGLAGFPTTPGCYQPGWNGGFDAVITKLNPTGSAQVYSTYLGGAGFDRTGRGIAVDAAGNAYFCGSTDGGFPTTAGVFRTTYQGGTYDVWATKMNATGTALVYSTYLGGANEDWATGLAVDAAGNAHVTGYTTSNPFPTTADGYQTTYGGNRDAFVTKLNATGTALVYSTYLGGTTTDTALELALDAIGSAVYVAGWTNSNNFPTTTGAFQTTFRGVDDAFVTKFQLVTPVTSANVNTATGTGVATFTTSSGSIGGLTALTQPQLACQTAPPNFNFPHGFFSFTITNIIPGATVTITIILPSNMPTSTQYWKCINGQWVNCSSILGSNDGDSILTLTLTDGGPFDADRLANGIIVDPGGPAIGAAVGEQLPSALRASPKPPNTNLSLNPSQMSVQYLSVNPKQTSANQPVTISTNVVNTGDEAGNFFITLNINGQAEQTRAVSVGSHGTQPVKFTVTRAQPGTYAIDIEGQKASFIINGAGNSSTSTNASNILIAILIFGALAVVAVIVILLSRRPA